MIGHLGLNVEDLAATKRYYDQVMPMLAFETYLVGDNEISYRPAGGKAGTYLFFYGRLEENGYSQHATGLQHLAFMVPTRTRVRDVHELVGRLGSQILNPPRTFPQYAQPYYATFWRDLNGFMVEAVCHHDRD
jgi:catechol 2,3-dioxygenase-like lactoylglutathione lyase family enzyme